MIKIHKPSRRNLIALAICSSLVSAGAYCAKAQISLGRSPEAKQAELDQDWAWRLEGSRAMMKVARDEEEVKAQTKRYNEALVAGVGNPKRTEVVAANIATTGSIGTPEAMAFSILQQQKIIEQNAQIIELLKAKK